MGIDGMRVGGGRCPPLIVAGLIVACFLLVCNWWSLSAENTELLRQIDGLSQQLKISAEQRDQCVTLRSKLEQRYKTAEEKVTTLHEQLGQERESSKSKDTGLSMCKIELDSLKKLDVTRTATVETLRLEKETINEQLEEKKEDIKKLQEEFEKVQDELSSLKLSQDLTANKKTPAAESQVLPRAVKPSAPQLGPVREGAVEVSSSGRQGIKYHGIPVLPRDPPGAVRQLPRLSVTMLKAAAEKSMVNDTKNGGNQEEQNIADSAGGQLQSDEADTEVPEDNSVAQESLRDQVLQPQASDPDTKANGA